MNKCCRDNPCQNNGTCLTQCTDAHRIKCICPKGFMGRLCEVKIRCCQDVLKEDRQAQNGDYFILFLRGTIFPIFCLFDHKAMRAWALITSYEYQHNDKYKDKPFTIGFPYYYKGIIFSDYRITLSVMKYLRTFSTHWAATCNITRHSTTLNTTDCATGEFTNIDILGNVSAPPCSRVEYINIRNDIRCGNCTACVAQDENMMRIGLFCGQTLNCDVQANFRSNHFGKYSSLDERFSCVNSPTSKTQWWIGGPLEVA